MVITDSSLASTSLYLKASGTLTAYDTLTVASTGGNGVAVYGGLALLATGLFLGGRMIKKSFRKV